MKELVKQALEHDKFSIAKLISLFEDERPQVSEQRDSVMALLKASKKAHRALFLGLTGTPGAGKSTLTGELALRLTKANKKISIAVVAIDPASQASGGALLGDRTRTHFPVNERRLFFRSQSSDRELGGISPHTFQVCRLLHYLFDIVIVETVGIGQNEIAVKDLADFTFLVLQPFAGDQVQFMKAGIMEIPDFFIMNKCDEKDAAAKSYHTLKASLGFVRPDEDDLKIFKTSALTGEGLDALTLEIEALYKNHAADIEVKEVFFFEQWVLQNYGRHGLDILKSKGSGARSFIKMNHSFDLACGRFYSFLKDHI